MPALAAKPRPIVILQASASLDHARKVLERDAGHQGFPVVDDDGVLVGVATRRDLHTREGSRVADVMSTPPVFMSEDGTLRQAADLMKKHGVGRIPIVTRHSPHRVVGITTRSDLVH